ncbi:MAG: prepilin-type N-terminal cleavage/methylation domain-containing protein [Planctomycetes bacterium]|nr:prepilin-type N-terminal cleavage/methylation domain-containing protein [Planctomycetota bacterium]
MRRRAFSLVELMVVVSIISLLVAILLPSLKDAQRNARSVVCATHERQMGLAVQAYCGDHFGRLYKYYRTTGLSTGGLTYDTYWMHIFSPYFADNRVMLCPEAPVDYSGQWDYVLDTPKAYSGWGTVSVAWGGPDVASTINFIRGFDGSFALNAWMLDGRNYRRTDGADPVFDARDERKHWRKLDNPTRPDATPLFADSMWVDVWFENNVNGGPNWGPPPTLTGSNSSASGRVCINRHGRAVNVVFVDGSAHQVPLEGLWGLMWNTESTQTQPPWALPAK